MHISGPVYPKRLPVITFNAETTNHLDVTISGGLRAFEFIRDALGIPTKKIKNEGGGGIKNYVRI